MEDSILRSHEVGEGLPVLVVHGWEMDGKVEELDFEPIFTKMSGFKRIYVDLPGMGSTPANGIKDLDDMLLRLVQFIDARLGKSKFLLMGSSCGGYLAHALAQRYIDQVDGLLLRVPVIEPDGNLRDLDPFKPIIQNDQLISAMSSEDKELLVDVLVQTPAYIKSLKARSGGAVLAAMKTANNEVLDSIRTDPRRYKLSFGPYSKHAKLLAPTLILSGRHDEVVGYRDSLRLLELYPRSTFVVLDRGNHALPVDENEDHVFGALVRDWLYRVTEWRDRVDE